MNDLISVIVPVYNVEEYLKRCLNSVLNQTYSNLEIILVDDGSKDSSGKLCDDYALLDSRIKVIHKKNGGLSSARNVGLKLAQGDYIGFVDSDDWISLDMYELLHQICKDEGADIACSRLEKVPSHRVNKFKRDYIARYNQEEYALKFFKINSQETVHYVVNKLYKQKIAKKMKFPAGLINEDVEGFFYALIESNKIVETSQITYFYWKNSDGISFKWFSHKQLDLLSVWDDVKEQCIKLNKTEWINYAEMNYERAHFGLLCRLMLNSQEEDGKYIEVQKKLLESLRKYYWNLMGLKMPFNRKILMTFMSINFNFTRRAVRIVNGGHHE